MKKIIVLLSLFLLSCSSWNIENVQETINYNSNTWTINSNTWILNNTFSWIIIDPINMITEESLKTLDDKFKEYLSSVKLWDFKNLKFSSKQSNVNIIDTDFKKVFYYIFIINNLNIDNCTLLPKEQVDYCKADIYIMDLLVNKNKSICSKFKQNNDFWNILWSQLNNREVCDNLLYLLNVNLSDEDIKKQLIKIQWIDDTNTLNTFLSLYNNKDYCEKIDILWDRLRCYSMLYNKDFSSKFNNVIYLKLLDTKYLYKN